MAYAGANTPYPIAIIGGPFGIVAGSELFRHKTLNYSFLVTVYFTATVWLLILLELHQDLGYPSGRFGWELVA